MQTIHSGLRTFPALRSRFFPSSSKRSVSNRLRFATHARSSLTNTRPVRHRIRAKQSSVGSDQSESRDLQLGSLTDALFLSFIACKAQSLFALTCFVKTIMALYNQDCTMNELQVLVAMKPLECGTTILTDSEQNVLLCWAVIIMLTLQQLSPEEDRLSAERINSDSVGMKGFVEQVLKSVESGRNLETLLEMQREVNEQSNMVTLSVKLMQLNTLIVTLTAEIVLGLSQKSSENDSYARSFIGEVSKSRDLAVKCLICFMSGSQGSVYCIDKFISSVMESYLSNLTAKQLVDSISEEEYDQAWRLLPVLDTGGEGTGASITRQLFGRWVSIVFITLAESGLEHRLSSSASGWGWAFDVQRDEDMFEMTNLSNFVQNSLRRVTEEDAKQELDLSQRLQDVPDMLEFLPSYREQAKEQKMEQYGTPFMAVEDEELGKTSSTALAFWQMIFLVHLTYRKLLVFQQEQP